MECKDAGLSAKETAAESTFRRAWNKLEEEKKVKLLTCKGAFRTCLTCNVVDEMLMNASKLESSCIFIFFVLLLFCCILDKSRSRGEYREATLNFKAMHLDQQAQERDEMKRKRALATEFDKNGQPKYAFFLTGKRRYFVFIIGLRSSCKLIVDAMTATAANTPHIGARGSKLSVSHNSKDNCIESRIIGVEVVCGVIDTHFIYFTDNLVGHGGNVMIEVFRQSECACYYFYYYYVTNRFMCT